MTKFLIVGAALCALCGGAFAQTRAANHDRDAKMRQSTHQTVRHTAPRPTTHWQSRVNDHDGDEMSRTAVQRHRTNHGGIVSSVARRRTWARWRNHGQMVNSVARRHTLSTLRKPRSGTGGTRTIMPWRTGHQGTMTQGGVRLGHPRTMTRTRVHGR